MYERPTIVQTPAACLPYLNHALRLPAMEDAVRGVSLEAGLVVDVDRIEVLGVMDHILSLGHLMLGEAGAQTWAAADSSGQQIRQAAEPSGPHALVRHWPPRQEHKRHLDGQHM